MMLYRVHYTHNGGESGGYSWHMSKRDATDAVNEYLRGGSREMPDAKVEAIELPKATPKGVLVQMLQRYASHPDNG